MAATDAGTAAANRPPIGITARTEEAARPYVDAVERNGGAPMVLTPEAAPLPHEAVQRVDGLLLTGGANIDPRQYAGVGGSDPAVDAKPDRDAVELPLLRAALDADLPALGICRGMQALNVVMGGTLIQELEGHGASQEADEESAYHRIWMSPGSRLAAVVGSGGVRAGEQPPPGRGSRRRRRHRD